MTPAGRGALPLIKSAIAETVWPAMPGKGTSSWLAFQFQLERSQWMSAEEIRERQFRQLESLLAHAERTVPYHAQRLRAAGWRANKKLTAEIWAGIPPLTRRQILDSGTALQSSALPPSHGKPSFVQSSGSTGMPIKVLTTPLAGLFWNAFNLRDHLWARRDFAKNLAIIRDVHFLLGDDAATKAGAPHGLRRPHWGSPINDIFATGTSSLLHLKTDVADQVAWLRRENPHYLVSYPNNVKAIARHCLERGIKLPRLEQVSTLAEVMTPEIRRLCREAWGVPVKDIYSAVEVGFIALQCPDHEHYHVQAEGVMVEVLDEQDRPCQPGQSGRVVVTSLHNFAMPMIRYVSGDHAEVGEPCPCGRGLPVLRRVLGRTRNMLQLPSGKKVWPLFAPERFVELADIVQFQLIQKSLQELEVRLVTRRAVTAEEERRMTAFLNDKFGHNFDTIFSYLAEIPRGPGGKYEEFKSEIVS